MRGVEFDHLVYATLAVVLGVLSALWIRLFPTREDLEELRPIARLLDRIVRRISPPFVALGHFLAALLAPLVREYREPRQAPEHEPHEFAGRKQALERIHRSVNDEGGGLSLAAFEPSDGALSVSDAAGDVSLASKRTTPTTR